MARVQRRIAIKAIRSYNTISYVAAGLLARASPIDLLAVRASRIFDRVRGMRTQGATSTVHALRTMAEEENKKVLAEWKNRLEDPSLPSLRLRDALVLRIEWVNRKHGSLSYRMTYGT